jgi:glycosyltransferase involved in cell wall biosynthesis
MRIALVHNIGNNFFALGRYLRDLGHDADLYCQRDYDKWLPKHDDPLADSYSWVRFVDFTDSKSHRFEFLKGYDAVICTGLKSMSLPAAIQRAGIKIHCYMPYGGDITDCLSEFERNPDIWRDHFTALKEIPFIVCGTVEPVYGLLTGLGISHVRGYAPCVYARETPEVLSKKSNDRRLIIFSPARHLWVSADDCAADFDIYRGIKRNDTLIKAFDKLCRWSRGGSSELLLVNYGPDVQASVKLIRTLKHSSSRIRFFKRKLPRSELFRILQSSDIMANAFRPMMHQFGTGVQEALASGCIVANHVGGPRVDITQCPILDASDEDELFYGLFTLEQSVELRRALQESAARWFSANLGVSLAQRLVNVLIATREGSIPFDKLADIYSDGTKSAPVSFLGNSDPITFDAIARVKQEVLQGNSQFE